MSKPYLYAFIGVRGSGKTYRRNEIIKYLTLYASTPQTAIPIDFKDGLIEMVNDLLGFPVPADEKEYDYFKSSVIGLHKGIISRLVSALVDTVTRDALTGRKVLQRVGTDMIRSRMPNYWVDIFMRKAINQIKTNNRHVVCADMRFPNEVSAILSLSDIANIKFIFCDYKSPRYSATDPHESEQLAQTLLKMGFKDGQEIPASVMNEITRA